MTDLDKRLEEILTNHLVQYTDTSLTTDEAVKKLQAIIQEARIEEWETVLKAEITYGGSPAPFNPEGLPIKTSATEDMTRLLHEYAKTRINQLKGKE